MAEDLTPRDDVRAELVPETEPEPEPARAAAAAGGETPPYQNRFQLLFGVLLGVGLAAVAATALFLAVGSNSGSDIKWSVWRPTASNGQDALQQIADHVGQRYTLPSGHQLVAVNASDLQLLGLPVTVAIQAHGDISLVNGKGVMYTLCGLGQYCSIKEGKPSVARHIVLQREALELALYTFRYVKNVDEVVAIMPPKPGDKPNEVMYFRRKEVNASLDRPLAATLPGAPPAINRLNLAQAEFVNRLTGANLYQFQPQQGGDERIYLVLEPLQP